MSALMRWLLWRSFDASARDLRDPSVLAQAS